jgi:hypothetical protein
LIALSAILSNKLVESTAPVANPAFVNVTAFSGINGIL